MNVKLVSTLLLTLTAAPVHAQECSSNCVHAQQVGDEHFLITKGRAGEIVDIDRLGGPDLPTSVVDDINRQLAGLPPSADNHQVTVQHIQTKSGDTTTETIVSTYKTSTETVVVVTVIIRNAAGDIIGVSTKEYRFKTIEK